MEFLLSNSSIGKLKFKHTIKLNKFYNLYTDNLPALLKDTNKKTYLLGKIFGYYKEGKFIKSKIKNIPKAFRNFNKIRENIDGNFCFFTSINNKINFQIDGKGTSDIFYSYQKGIINISNNLLLIKKLFKKRLSLDNYSIMNSLVNISKRPPLNDTFFKEIKRLSLDKNIIFKKKKN